MMAERRLPTVPRPLILWGIISILLWSVGLHLASRNLPEWSPVDMADRSHFTAQFNQVAQRLEISLLGSRPEIQLVIPPGLSDRELTKQAQLSQRSVWLRTEGQLQARFSPRGHIESLVWTPVALRVFLEVILGRDLEGHRSEDLAPLLLWPGERLGDPLETAVAGVSHQLIPLHGSDPPMFVELAVTNNRVFEARRRPGDARQELGRLSERLMGRFWVRFALRGALLVIVVAAFLFLLASRRIDFRDGLYLMAIALLVPWPTVLSQMRGGLVWWHVLPPMVFAALFLLLLWSVGESWARATDPRFTTSLDFLRVGHLGPRGGRALLAGWLLGGGLAGLYLLSHVVARWLGIAIDEPSVIVPVFGATGHPFYHGPMVAGCILLAVPLVHRLMSPRWRFWGTACLGALLLVPSSPFASLPFAFGASLIIACWLVLVYRRFGLAALLVASTLSLLMMGSALLWPVMTWAPGSFAISLGIVLAVPWVAWVGLRRPPERAVKALIPGFMQRVEEERRVKYEMDLLTRMQVGMLPAEPPGLPGYDIAVGSWLATEAGGDLYDFVEDETGDLWLAAGDVAGHGYSCAIELAMVKSAIHSLVSSDKTPAEVLSKIDRVLRSSRQVRSFSTLALLRLEPASGRLLLANAGHPYPWILRRGKVEEIELPGLPLGHGPPRIYRDATAELQPGDALFLSSDGLFESIDSRGRTYGFERPKRLLESLRGVESGQQILDAVVADWQRFLGSQAAVDDTSLVTLHRSPEDGDSVSDQRPAMTSSKLGR